MAIAETGTKQRLIDRPILKPFSQIDTYSFAQESAVGIFHLSALGFYALHKNIHSTFSALRPKDTNRERERERKRNRELKGNKRKREETKREKKRTKEVKRETNKDEKKR